MADSPQIAYKTTAGTDETLFRPCAEDITTLDGVGVSSQLLQALGLALRTADGAAKWVTAAVPVPISQTAGTIGDGRTTVTTSGTEVQISGSSVPCLSLTITAELDNTDVIVVGTSTVVAALATRRGTPLSPGESVTLAIDNLNKVYIDAMVNTEGVTYSYLAL